jgi:hypothetical protein
MNFPAGTTTISEQVGQSLKESFGLRQRRSLPTCVSTPPQLSGGLTMAAAKSFFEKNLSQNLFASAAAAREFAAGPGDWIGGAAGTAIWSAVPLA